jgi:microcystin-dependent protein
MQTGSLISGTTGYFDGAVTAGGINTSALTVAGAVYPPTPQPTFAYVAPTPEANWVKTYHETMAPTPQPTQAATPNLTAAANYALTQVAGVPTPVPTATLVATAVPPPVGAVEMYAAAAAPTGWLLCDGTSYLRADYAALFAVIGTTYGSADGTHFNVPDFRGIFPRGAGTTNRVAGVDISGAAYVATLGAYQTDQMEAHWHNILYRDFAAGSGTSYHTIRGTTDGTSAVNVTGAISSGTGTPRLGAESRPANLGITFIIKW